MKEKSLPWLENYENQYKDMLIHHFSREIEFFERLIEVIELIREENSMRIADTTLDKLLESKDEELVCRTVSTILLSTASRRLLAARRLLLSGYQESMFSSLRDMIEALYYSDICRQNVARARHWISGKYIEKPSSLKLHKCIEKNRKGEVWKMLSSAGVHPCLDGSYLSMFTNILNIPIAIELRGDQSSLNQKIKLEKKERNIEDTHSIIMFALILAFDFLVYLHDTYSDICHNFYEIRTRMENLEEEYQRLIETGLNKHKI